jgi:hypothetical protein
MMVVKILNTNCKFELDLYIFSVISAFKYVFQVVVLLTLEKKYATSITFLFENLTMD